MRKKIVVVAATDFEIEGFAQAFPNIETLVTGIGLTMTAFELAHRLSSEQYDLVINAGIAGALDRNLKIGEVVEVVSDCFGDLGAEQRDGSFQNIFQMGFLSPDQFPFSNGKLVNPSPFSQAGWLKTVDGISINTVHGFEPSINRFLENNQSAVETMEGAAFFYVCLKMKQPFLAIRSISNYVEPRDKSKWDIPLAIKNLNEVLIAFFKQQS